MAASSFHDGHPVNPDRTWLELARRSLRNRATAWLLLCGLLLGQSALYLHHLEHALHADNDACSLCLIGEHTSAGPRLLRCRIHRLATTLSSIAFLPPYSDVTSTSSVHGHRPPCFPVNAR